MGPLMQIAHASGCKNILGQKLWGSFTDIDDGAKFLGMHLNWYYIIVIISGDGHTRLRYSFIQLYHLEDQNGNLDNLRAITLTTILTAFKVISFNVWRVVISNYNISQKAKFFNLIWERQDDRYFKVYWVRQKILRSRYFQHFSTTLNLSQCRD